ncbi:hypothetical protein [Cupriavidus taiwanensis]|uniref:hypothetical protein n=1 Tax=Cupriavidus taiwanensis TaxID=164546 RepID=UPI0011C14FBF|nr:hypothetical protein [Cupriavidus taiwanensis]
MAWHIHRHGSGCSGGNPFEHRHGGTSPGSPVMGERSAETTVGMPATGVETRRKVDAPQGIFTTGTIARRSRPDHALRRRHGFRQAEPFFLET